MTLVAGALAGCTGQSSTAQGQGSGPDRVDAPPRTGFLGDYSRLQRSKNDLNTWTEHSPGIGDYRTFIIDPVRIYPQETARGVPLDAETSAMLASGFHEELRESLSTVFAITDTPGPGVARVRAAVTQVALYKPSSGDVEADMGGAAMEMEVVDATTGRRLFAMVDSRSVSMYDNPPAPTRRFEHAHTTFRHWASRLVVQLGAFD